jgi:hypothetical protein
MNICFKVTGVVMERGSWYCLAMVSTPTSDVMSCCVVEIPILLLLGSGTAGVSAFQPVGLHITFALMNQRNLLWWLD